MTSGPPVVVMLYRCELCGRPQAKNRRVCTSCYRAGRSIRGGHCPDCGKEHGVGRRNRVYCDECRAIRDREEGQAYRAKRKMSGIERHRNMVVALKALACDEYARTHEPISDEEYDAKVRKLRALKAADVHCGDYGHPTKHHFVEADRTGGFGTLANQHMRGGEAGHGTDRETKTSSEASRTSRNR